MNARTQSRGEPILSARGIVNRFGKQKVHDKVSLDILPDEAVRAAEEAKKRLIGAKVFVDGLDVAGRPVEIDAVVVEIVLEGIVPVGDGLHLPARQDLRAAQQLVDVAEHAVALAGLALMQPVIPYSQADLQSKGLDIVLLLETVSLVVFVLALLFSEGVGRGRSKVRPPARNAIP